MDEGVVRRFRGGWLFNTGKEKGILKVNLKELGLSGAYEARDLWKRADQGTVQGDMAVELNGHGASMFRFSKRSNGKETALYSFRGGGDMPPLKPVAGAAFH